jgi:transposase
MKLRKIKASAEKAEKMNKARSYPKKINPKQLEAYVDRHPEATQKVIAARFRCSVRSVHSALKDSAIPYKKKNRSGRKLSPEQVERYILKHPKAKLSGIAAHFNCSRTTVSAVIKAYGIDYIHKTSDCNRGNRGNHPLKLPPGRLAGYIHNHPEADQKNIAAVFKCSARSVRSALKRDKIKYTKKSGRPRKLLPDELRQYVEEHPEATQKVIAVFFNCTVNAVSVSLRINKIAYINKNGVAAGAGNLFCTGTKSPPAT